MIQPRTQECYSLQFLLPIGTDIVHALSQQRIQQRLAMEYSFVTGKESCDVSSEDERTSMNGQVSMHAEAKDVVKELKEDRLDKGDMSFSIASW